MAAPKESVVHGSQASQHPSDTPDPDHELVQPQQLPALDRLNIMGLASPRSAILSAVIFNALIIVALIPLALRGVKFRPSSAGALLRRNLLIYGGGGLITPFLGIKLIDLLISAMGVK